MYVVIAGGGKVGSYLAQVMLSSGNEVAIIEQTLSAADRLSVQLEGSYLVINGDCCNSRFQEDAGIRRADAFVASTGQDDSNLVACEIASRVFHVPRCIARVNNPKNLRIFREVGIECVSSTTLIANLIEEEALSGAMSVVSALSHGNVQLQEISIGRFRHGSDEEGVAVADVPLPAGALVVAVSSKGDMEVASDKSLLRPGDAVIVAADSDAIDEVREAFRSL